VLHLLLCHRNEVQQGFDPVRLRQEPCGGWHLGWSVTDGHERSKDFLDPSEIDRLLAAARDNRHGVRDALLLLMMFRHGLRVTEAIKLRLDALNLKQSSLWVKRIKNSLSTQQPISGDELRAIKRYLATRSDRSRGCSCRSAATR
jgi:integrase